jgi:hypothetical protein
LDAQRPYEVVIIYDPGLEEDAIRAAVDRSTDLIRGRGGNPGRVDRWGKRRLAYEIRHQREDSPPGGWAQAATTGRLHGLLSRVLESHRDARVSAWEQAQQAVGASDGRVDIELMLGESAADSVRELVGLLDEADQLCAAGELLTLPAPDEVRRLRGWVDEEVWSQLRLGREPRPCPL